MPLSPHRTIRTILNLLTCLAAFVAAAPGCRSARPAVPPAPGPVQTIQGFAQGAGTYTATDVQPASLMPQDTIRGTLQWTGKDNQPMDIPFELTPTADGWELSVTGLRKTYYRRDGDRLLVFREDDPTQNARVEYDPAIVVLQPGPQPPEPRTTTMTIFALDTGKPRDRGTMTYRFDALGAAPLTTPAGQYDALLVRTHRQIDLKLADVTVETVEAYAAREGPVAEWSRREVKALGLFSDLATEVTQRAAPPASIDRRRP